MGGRNDKITSAESEIGLKPLPYLPPKGSSKRKAATGNGDETPTPQAPSLAEQLSYLNHPRPFKNPNYAKNTNRRTKNLKTVLTQERERERIEREKRRQEKEEQMDVDGENAEQSQEEEIPTCAFEFSPPSLVAVN
ncbi:hypothetical protein NLI96_g7949 [Meripilus lineatus]|uniref:Uncharacterized protein n=1 Tax=Meripilus lineatus TaxID=2056292 RepID=A0AAD5YBJ8_9APHY|nr:hypothetical protein NLI96_g7949 [Physisporinus lineatus]